MNRPLFAALLPLLVLAFAVLGVGAIGTLLLSVGEAGAIPVALLLVAIVTGLCLAASARAGEQRPEER